MNIYQNNTHRKDLSWLHFGDEPKVQERHQLKDQQSCTCAFVAYPTISIATRSTSPYMTIVFYAWLYRKFIEIQSSLRRKKLHKTNQSSTCLGGSFSNRNNVRAPIQFKRERQLQHLKRSIFFKDRHINFHINSTSVIRWVKRN